MIVLGSARILQGIRASRLLAFPALGYYRRDRFVSAVSVVFQFPACDTMFSVAPSER